MSQLDKKISGRQFAAARALLGIGQSELAAQASISVPTLKRMEASAGPAAGMANNVAAVRAALESAGVIFVDENGEGAGVRLRKEYKAGDYSKAAQHGTAKVENLRTDADGKIRADIVISKDKGK